MFMLTRRSMHPPACHLFSAPTQVRLPIHWAGNSGNDALFSHFFHTIQMMMIMMMIIITIIIIIIIRGSHFVPGLAVAGFVMLLALL